MFQGYGFFFHSGENTAPGIGDFLPQVLLFSNGVYLCVEKGEYMALIIPVRGIHPRFGRDCFLADNATVVGEVVMGDQCSVWFNAVVRGDVHSITIGNKTNIQDGAVVHCTYKKASVTIGSNVSIAHNAVVHGCTVMDNVLIGMGAVVMDHAVVQSGCVIAAGAVVLSGTVCESGYIYAGTPARKVKPVDDELRRVFTRTADNYVQYAGWYRDPDNRDY